MSNFYKLSLFIFLPFFICLQCFSQQVKLSFSIRGTANGEVANATIALNEQKFKADSLGNAVVTVTPGRYTLSVSSINYYSYSDNFIFTADTSMQIVMRVRESL